MNSNYSVKQLARLAGVTARTLHLYDQLGLLKPSLRTEAGYRWYGEAELLRLQQILFYKELDFPLKDIAEIIDDPEFDLVNALLGHKAALLIKRNRLNTLVNTIDKTIANLKNKTMKVEELYEGMPQKQAIAWRKEAVEKWGEDAIKRSENAMQEMGKVDVERLKADQKDISAKLKELMGQAPECQPVQEQIARHYANIRSFWGVSDPTDLRADTYRGLADLYVSDHRYTAANGTPDPAFAAFMKQAMIHFADTMLR